MSCIIYYSVREERSYLSLSSLYVKKSREINKIVLSFDIYNNISKIVRRRAKTSYKPNRFFLPTSQI